MAKMSLISLLVVLSLEPHLVQPNPDAKRLLEHLMTGYNKLIRPVLNDSHVLQVKFKLKLSQLLEVNEKNQIMTTNVWLKQEWHDYKLSWKSEEYGGVEVLYVPAYMIWLPDIVLYNNADGHYEVTIMTKAALHSNGTVIWEPPAVYNSMCQIDVTWFPFDEQCCNLTFGSWTYDGHEVDLAHYDKNDVVEKEEHGKKVLRVENGIDLSEFYPSVEFDIMSVPGVLHREQYYCCPAPYIDITYSITLRRKTLFYTINLIVPCVGISFLTILVFYLPSDCGEKVTLCISILISLTLFFLLLVEIIPSTSLVVPLIAKYLLFTMVMVTLSIVVTVITLNVHFRSPNTHNMSPWVKRIFLGYLPRLLLMRRPIDLVAPPVSPVSSPGGSRRGSFAASMAGSRRRLSMAAAAYETPPHHVLSRKKSSLSAMSGTRFSNAGDSQRPLVLAMRDMTSSFSGFTPLSVNTSTTNFSAASHESPHATSDATFAGAATKSACFVAEHLRKQEEESDIKEDWRYVALVLDRFFLWVFSTTCFFGTVKIILSAPVIFDNRTPLVGD